MAGFVGLEEEDADEEEAWEENLALPFALAAVEAVEATMMSKLREI